MSGHSKWSTIKRQKGATDAKRSQIFGKLSKMISNQVRVANGDINSPNVRVVIDKARAANMPKDTIERAIAKATEARAMDHITYECYGPGGVGIIIQALTDNHNKAAQEIKHILSKNGSALAGIGSVTWSFTREGGDWIPTTTIPLGDDDAEKLASLIDDLEDCDEVDSVFTNAE